MLIWNSTAYCIKWTSGTSVELIMAKQHCWRLNHCCCLSATETRCYILKSPVIDKKCPKSSQSIFLLESNVFHKGLKTCQLFGLVLQENLLPRSFQNSPIWCYTWTSAISREFCCETSVETILLNTLILAVLVKDLKSLSRLFRGLVLTSEKVRESHFTFCSLLNHLPIFVSLTIK